MAKIRAAAYCFGRSRCRSRRIESRRQRMVRGVEPIGAPFPGVAGDGKDAKSISGKRVDGRDARKTIFGRIAHRKFALPDVAEMPAARCQLVAPGIEFLL